MVTRKAQVVDDIKGKIEFVAGGNPEKPSEIELYQGTANSVREELFKAFNRTNKYFEYASTAADRSLDACKLGQMQAAVLACIHLVPSSAQRSCHQRSTHRIMK